MLMPAPALPASVILRVFHAHPHPGMDRDFEAFLREVGLPLMRKQAGCRAVTMGKTRWGGAPHIVVISTWDSLDALKAFVGEKYQNPVILPEESHMVKEVEVEHFEVLDG